MLIPLLASLLFLGLETGLRILKAPWISFIVVIVGFLALIIVSFWSQVSLVYTIKERDQKLGIKESFAKGWHKILSFWWISILVGFITMGGFLLFIIPGIIFATWFSLALYVLVSEDIKGMDAFFRSKQLVKGDWWKIFWRFLVMGLVVAVIVVPIAVIAGIFNIPYITNIITTLISPFFITFSFLIYEKLKQLKGEIPFEPPKRKTKIGFILIGIIGALLIPAMLFASIFLLSFGGAKKTANDAGVMAYMSQIRMAAELIYIDEDYSYSKVSCSYSDIVSLCNYIDEQLGEKPTIYSSKNAYCSYVKLLSEEYSCIDSTGGGRKTAIDPGKSGYCDGITFICP